jgi:hypothetical protein
MEISAGWQVGSSNALDCFLLYLLPSHFPAHLLAIVAREAKPEKFIWIDWSAYAQNLILMRIKKILFLCKNPRIINLNAELQVLNDE